MQKAILNGSIILGVIGFVTFITLLVSGFVLSSFGASNDFFSIFRWSVIGVVSTFGFVLWYKSTFGKTIVKQLKVETLTHKHQAA